MVCLHFTPAMDHTRDSAHYFFPSAPEYLPPNMYFPQPDSQVYHHVPDTQIGHAYFHSHSHSHAARNHAHPHHTHVPMSYSLAHSGHALNHASHTHSHTDSHLSHTPTPSSQTPGHPSHADLHPSHSQTSSSHNHTNSGHTHIPSSHTYTPFSHTYRNSSHSGFRTHVAAVSTETDETRVTPTPQAVGEPASTSRIEESMGDENFTPWQQSVRQQRVSLASDVFDQWCRIGLVEGLQTDTDIARFLIKQYETTQNGVQPSAQCLKCRAALPLFCKKCQTHAAPVQMSNAPSPRASASAFDIRFLLNEDSDSQLSSKTEERDVDLFSPSTHLNRDRVRDKRVNEAQETDHSDVNTFGPSVQMSGKQAGDKWVNQPQAREEDYANPFSPSQVSAGHSKVNPLSPRGPCGPWPTGTSVAERATWASEPLDDRKELTLLHAHSPPHSCTEGGVSRKALKHTDGDEHGSSNSVKNHSPDCAELDVKHEVNSHDGSALEVDVTEDDVDNTVDDFVDESMDMEKFAQAADEKLEIVDQQAFDDKVDIENMSQASDEKLDMDNISRASDEELAVINKQASDVKHHCVKKKDFDKLSSSLSTRASDENLLGVNAHVSDKNVYSASPDATFENVHHMNSIVSDESLDSLNRSRDENVLDVAKTVDDNDEIKYQQPSLTLCRSHHPPRNCAEGGVSGKGLDLLQAKRAVSDSERNQLRKTLCNKLGLEGQECESVNSSTEATDENYCSDVKKSVASLSGREETFARTDGANSATDVPLNSQKSAKCHFKLACEQTSLKEHAAENVSSPISSEHENATKYKEIHGARADMHTSSEENARSATVPKQLKPKTFTCDQCQKMFKTASGLKRHSKVHTADKPLKCRICPALFKFQNGLDTHMKVHKQEKLNKCQVCEKTFRTIVSLQLHIERHQHEARGNSECKQGELVDLDKSTDPLNPSSPSMPSSPGGEEDSRPECVKVECSPRAHSSQRRGGNSSTERDTQKAKGSHEELMEKGVCTEELSQVQSAAKRVNSNTYSTRQPSASRSGRNSRASPFSPGGPCGPRPTGTSRTKRAKCVKGEAQEEKKGSVAKYHCLYCQETFTNLRGLSKHVATHAEKIVIECKFCLKTFNNAEALRTHIECRHSKAGKQRYKCVECSACFTTRARLTTHSRIHSGERPFVCEACGASFALQHTLLLHQRTHTGDKPYQCTDCGKSFTWKRSLHYHRSKHSKTFASLCHLCGAWFRTPEHLADHLRRHANTREFSCRICGKAFKTKSDLYSHNTHVHSDIKSFKCSECGYAFPTKSALKKHSRKHSGEKPYKCTQCSKAFAYFSSLSAHRKLHEDKQFSCHVCGASFVMQWGLNTHMRKHTGQKPYQCKLCDKAFAWHSGLKNHMRKHAE